MSTNYYAKQIINFPLNFTVNSFDDLEELANKIKKLSTAIHLGKSSRGWNFLGSWNDGVYYSNYQSYLDYINQPDIEIYDECDNKLTKNEFITIVTTWKGKPHESSQYSKIYKFPELDFMDGDWS